MISEDLRDVLKARNRSVKESYTILRETWCNYVKTLYWSNV